MAALNNSVQGPELYIVTSNKSIYIVNVKRANAGKYTCWTSGCDGHRQKLLIINLCVIIVHNSEDSSVSCAVICNLEFSNIAANSTSNVETGTMTKSVFVDPYGSLNCSAKQMFEGYSTVQYSTHGPSNAVNKTTAFPVHLCCCGLNGSAVVEEDASVVYSSVVIRRPAATTKSHITHNDCVYSEIKV
ncbi:uncharacterized protein LOC119897308 isoform X3 [Micropterus salmoides]|nr:uncharacterized protein LOC119897308 isoform X3 [Micropterus salmoides]